MTNRQFDAVNDKASYMFRKWANKVSLPQDEKLKVWLNIYLSWYLIPLSKQENHKIDSRGLA